MAIDGDEIDRITAEEQPGPDELQSAIGSDALGEIIQQTPLTVNAGASLAVAISRMQEEHRGYVAILEEGKLVGIFTERDVLLRVAGRQLALDQTVVDAYMTRDPITLPADASIAHAVNLMVLEGFRHIPLVNDAGQLVAVASMRNLMEYLSDFFARDVLNLPPSARSTYRNREGA
jgi:CBS domain-containing protein